MLVEIVAAPPTCSHPPCALYAGSSRTVLLVLSSSHPLHMLCDFYEEGLDYQRSSSPPHLPVSCLLRSFLCCQPANPQPCEHTPDVALQQSCEGIDLIAVHALKVDWSPHQLRCLSTGSMAAVAALEQDSSILVHPHCLLRAQQVPLVGSVEMRRKGVLRLPRLVGRERPSPAHLLPPALCGSAHDEIADSLLRQEVFSSSGSGRYPIKLSRHLLLMRAVGGEGRLEVVNQPLLVSLGEIPQCTRAVAVLLLLLNHVEHVEHRGVRCFSLVRDTVDISSLPPLEDVGTSQPRSPLLLLLQRQRQHRLDLPISCGVALEIFALIQS
mmetsp:Transcript_18960/g.62343  ORF Transcript_18960/g.62343 Transcript_18960/m.62343 type:complete len:325 (-) Transcript_18960:613-1587(-)